MAITDRCTGCALSSLDLTPTAFSQLADTAPYVVEWIEKLVICRVTTDLDNLGLLLSTLIRLKSVEFLGVDLGSRLLRSIMAFPLVQSLKINAVYPDDIFSRLLSLFTMFPCIESLTLGDIRDSCFLAADSSVKNMGVAPLQLSHLTLKQPTRQLLAFVQTNIAPCPRLSVVRMDCHNFDLIGGVLKHYAADLVELRLESPPCAEKFFSRA